MLIPVHVVFKIKLKSRGSLADESKEGKLKEAEV